MILLTLCGAVLLYVIGFLFGRQYERDCIMEGVYGVMSKMDKNTFRIDSVTYYYSESAYNTEIQKLKEEGKDVAVYGDDEEYE